MKWVFVVFLIILSGLSIYAWVGYRNATRGTTATTTLSLPDTSASASATLSPTPDPARIEKCNNALAFMTFENAAASEEFIKKCVAGENVLTDEVTPGQ